ncbi:MAG: ATP-binding protein [Desulfobacteraceae bacterium]|nr:ATP-binding protein [Desulfobacteraceae bacterium]
MEREEQQQLRRRAEEKLDRKIDHLKDKLDDDSLRLLHELKVHQIELEMQNEELRRVQIELEQARDRYVDLFDSSPVGLLTLDRNGVVLEANRTAGELIGRERDHLLGVPLRVRVEERDKELFAQFLARCGRQPGGDAIELGLQRPEGPALDVRIECQTTGPAERPEHRLALIDITEKKKLEKREIQTQKIESLGVMAGGIAHDFNNLLTAMLGNISLARMFMDHGTPSAEKMEMAERAALRARDLTQRLLTFARGGEPLKKPVAVGELVREAAGLPLRGAPHRLEFDFPPQLWPAAADTGQLGQVVQNLVINAIQAMPGGGEIEIWGRNLELAADNVLGLPPGRYVRIAVRDQGPGIGPEVLEKIFDPYFTTKNEGSGLGLAVSRSIVERHGGRLTVDSAPGRGARFEIYLPAAEAEAPAPAMEAPAAIEPGEGRVLVMDDEEMVREVLAELLHALGYQAVTASDGKEALRLYEEARREGRPFVAVILDLVVPGGMGGEETMQKLQELDPAVKAIVSSGYSDTPVGRDYRRYGFAASLPKPYNLGQLSQVLHELLPAPAEQPG